MQSTMVRMAGSGHSEDRVVERGGREATASSEVNAHAMENNSTNRWEDRYPVPGEISEITG